MVMDRRILCVGVAVLASSFLLLTGAASAKTVAPGTCEVKSLSSFVAQGEFATVGTVGDVIEVSCDPYTYSNGAEVKVEAFQLWERCRDNLTWYVPAAKEPTDENPPTGPGVKLKLDGDGNANVGLIAGPNCQPGGSLITVDELESPYETYVTEYKVLPSENTEEGLFITPKSQVEDQETSSVVTIAQAEFPGHGEKHVNIGAGQLYNRCPVGDRLEMIKMNRQSIEETEGAGQDAIELDNNGNGFVLLLGEESCAEGPSLIEADLEASPFTTIPGPSTAGKPGGNPVFTVESPKVR
jgi:hypothetical protein